MINFKNLIKTTLQRNGYDASLYPIAKQPYTGPNVAFIHIAKSGGISIDQAFRKAIAAPGQRRIDRDTTLIASQASFGKAIDSAERSYEFSEHHAAFLSKILDGYLAKNWQYISGHVTVNTELLQKYHSKYQFVTVLRDPVERFISNYIFNKLTNTHPFMLPNKFNTDDLINEANTILTSKRGWQLANTNTMFICGRYPKDVDEAKAMQQEFSHNIKQFALVGFLNELDKFEQNLQLLTGRTIKVGNKNSADDLSSEWQLKVKIQLLDYFSDKSIQKKLQTLCEVEQENYLAAKSMAADK
ncbi:sulfotransferase family 2 domain-containing protein [Colwellia sp. MEBiC06753]